MEDVHKSSPFLFVYDRWHTFNPVFFVHSFFCPLCLTHLRSLSVHLILWPSILFFVKPQLKSERQFPYNFSDDNDEEDEKKC